jgi:hypothetical protein
MVKKLVLIAAATAVAIALSPTDAFAKKKAKEPKCTPVGALCTMKLDKVGQATGWARIKECNYKGQMQTNIFPCYKPGGMCPAATCKSSKK